VVATLLYLGCNTEPGDDSDASHEGTAGAVSASGGDAGARAGALNAGQGGTPPAGAGQAGASQGVGGAGVGGVDGGAGTGGGGGGSAEPLTLRVLTFNIKTGSLSSLQTVADIIEASGADVVGLQEVDKGTQRAGGVDQPMLLGELTDMQPFFAPGLHEYDGGQYGVAALVSHDFRAVTVTPHDLEQPAAGEARAALEVRLARIQKNADIPDFIFITTHWDLVSENRVAQAEHVNRIGMTGEELAPLLLVGDLNARSGSEPIDRLLGFWTAADEAVFGIDWIVHRGERWQVSDVRELTDADHPQATTASDHVPVVASYTLAPP